MASDDDRGKSTQYESGRGTLKWLDDALREESGYDYDGGGEIGSVDYIRLQSLERE